MYTYRPTDRQAEMRDRAFGPNRLLPALLMGAFLAIFNAPEPAAAGFKDVCKPDDPAYDANLCRGFRLPPRTDDEGSEPDGVRVLFRRSETPERHGALITVTGFGADYYTKCREGQKKLITKEIDALNKWKPQWRLGMDLYRVIWCKPYDPIQTNAARLEEVLELIRDGSLPGSNIAPYGDHERIMLVAASMGGVVSRYALTTMEQRGADHNVDLFVSFDSPQEGAYLPIGIQHAGEYLEDTLGIVPQLRGELEQFGDADVPSARQMLLLHHSADDGESAHPSHYELYAELDELGYPRANGIRNVAIGNGGTSNPEPQRPYTWESGFKHEFFNEEFKLRWKVLGRTVWKTKLDVRLSGPLGMTVRRLNHADRDVEVFRGQFQTPQLQINGKPIHATATPEIIASIIGLPDFIPTDSFLGGAAQDIRNLVDAATGRRLRWDRKRRVRSPYAYGRASSGTSDKFARLDKGLSRFGYSSGSTAPDVFIPTSSALGLEGEPLLDFETLTPEQTPFDHFYLEDKDTAHVEHTELIKQAFCTETHDLLLLPYIGEISPDRRPQASTDFELTVSGDNFTEGDVILWRNGTPGAEETVELATTYVDRNTLATVVPRELIESVTDCPSEHPGACEVGLLGPGESRRPIEISIQDDGQRPATRGPNREQPSCKPAGSANFQIIKSPIQLSKWRPTPQDTITATYHSDWHDGCVPHNPRTSVEHGRITIETTVPDGFCTFAVTPYEISHEIGPLPAGEHELIMAVDDPTWGRELARHTFQVRYPQPEIWSAEPGELPALSSHLELTVVGANFTENRSVVIWNGEERPTLFVDDNTLIATLRSEDLDEPRSVSISVATDDPLGVRTSEELQFVVGPPVLSLTAVEPSALDEGSPTATLRLEGHSFTSETVISWSGPDQTVPLPTRLLSDELVEVTVASSLLQVAGSYLLRAEDADVTTEPLSFAVVGEDSAGTAGDCVPGDEQLCLNDGRFGVQVDWETRNGETGRGRVEQLTADTGYVWFFAADNVELVVKVLDGCGVNGRHWVFLGGLTDVAVKTTVTDTSTGESLTYRNPLGTQFAPVLDTTAFSDCSATGSAAAAPASAVQAATGSTMQLNNSRFRVEANWTTSSSSGSGSPQSLTGDTGYFWFFDPANVEVVVKVLDACAINNTFWVFAGGLSDQGVELRVTDSISGASKLYSNPLGTAFQPVQDTAAFACR